MVEDTKAKTYDGLFGERPNKLKHISKKSSPVTRNAFIYLDSKEADFAQCSSCSAFTPDKMCAPLGIKVEAGWSCALYTPGKYDGAKPAKRVSAEDAGLVKTQVRCENCRYSDGKGHCGLYEKLNKALPDDFDLDVNINPKACCNAFEKK